jgi:hypothetical protein
LKKFNPTRYGPLSFANPNPNEACAVSGRGGRGGRGGDPREEACLQWDAISQIGTLLKNGGVPGLRAQHVYLTTQGADVVTYINAIQPHSKVFDGFVVKSAAQPLRRRARQR